MYGQEGSVWLEKAAKTQPQAGVRCHVFEHAAVKHH
jgi:hypothetical protein